MANQTTARRLLAPDCTLTILCWLALWASVASAQAPYYIGATLHNFGGPGDGNIPMAGVIFDSHGNLYGTTLEGGSGCVLPGCGWFWS